MNAKYTLDEIIDTRETPSAEGVMSCIIEPSQRLGVVLHFDSIGVNNTLVIALLIRVD